MKTHYLFITILLAGCIGTLTGCTTDEDARLPGDQVEVRFKLPGMYTSTDGFGKGSVRANPIGNTPTLQPLPEGETLWVLIDQVRDTLVDGTIRFNQIPPKPYKVLSSGAGNHSLYPLDVEAMDFNDSIVYNISESTTALPLMLVKGYTYRFRMLAPARELVYHKTGSLEGQYSVWIDNNQSLYANDDRYTETESVNHFHTVRITDPTDVVEFPMNPLIHQTIRLNVVVHPGTWVHDLDILATGFEVSGLATGPKRYLPDVKESLDAALVTNKGRASKVEYIRNPDRSMEWEMNILPVDLRSGPLSLILNLRINGNPAQCLIMLQPDDPLQHGRSYKLEYTIHLRDDIIVFSFTTLGWETEIIW